MEKTLLKDIAYFNTGGLCRLLLAPSSEAELRDALIRIKREGLPFFILGRGTNSLVTDDPWPGAVLSMHRLTASMVTGDRIVSEAGVENTSLSRMALKRGLGGIAWMNRLPGQIGATVRMNARCYGGEISQVVEEVEAYSPDGTKHIFDLKDGPGSVFKAYKDTLFMKNGMIVYRVTLALKKENQDDIRKLMNFCEEDRIGKHQFDHPTCGCVFKNNYEKEVSVSSGLLLDLAGAKKLRHRGAFVSPYHANFIFNQGADSHDIIRLSLLMREAVYKHFGVWLSYEMEILGDLPEDLKLKVRENRDPRYDTGNLAKARQIFNQKLQP